MGSLPSYASLPSLPSVPEMDPGDCVARVGVDGCGGVAADPGGSPNSAGSSGRPASAPAAPEAQSLPRLAPAVAFSGLPEAAFPQPAVGCGPCAPAGGVPPGRAAAPPVLLGRSQGFEGCHGSQGPSAAERGGTRKAEQPRRADASMGARKKGQAPRPREDNRTTVMMRNIPNNYSRDMLLEMLDEAGFLALYDFVYLPVDFSSGAGLGYAFVNLVDASLVPHFWEKFHGHSDWVLPTTKVCELSWSKPYQGLRANVLRYKNSSVMHVSIGDEFKPCVFINGARAPFPAPTRPLRPPTC